MNNPNDQPDQLTPGTGAGAGNSSVLRAVRANRSGTKPPAEQGLFDKLGESMSEFAKPANVVSVAAMFPEMLGGFGPHHAAAWEHLAGRAGIGLARVMDALGSDAAYAVQNSKLGDALLHGMDLQYLAQAAKNNPFLSNWLMRYLSAKQLEHFGIGNPDTSEVQADQESK